MGEAKGDERMAFAIYIVGGTNTLGSSSRRSMRERTMIVSDKKPPGKVVKKRLVMVTL